ncbi:diguanylate cyclase, partial [candidate division KSB3 bacterium]|nr:diguanylate cyclase [candidate division KSB3 bacterium]MBD3326901.1 diguanylate cyclase [candidate division KSB3 bacterium]
QQLHYIHPDLILLDVLMPAINGFETCRRIKQQPTTQEIPVIFMTALSETDHQLQGFAAGGVDYLIKPLVPQEVLMRVNLHLELQHLQHQLKAQNIRLEEQNSLLEEKNQQLQQEITDRRHTEMILNEKIDQIEIAKQEWESTADSLSHLICVLDNQGQIIRVNRAVEYWHLAKIHTARGQHLHALLHPTCQETTCHLHQFLTQALEDVAHHHTAEDKIEDPFLNRYIHVQIRPISPHQSSSKKPSSSFAVAIIHDITLQKRAERELQQRTRELTLLNQMSASLQACRDEAATYQIVTDICHQLFPSTAGVLFIIPEKKKTLKKVSAWGDPPDDIRQVNAEYSWVFAHNPSSPTDSIEHPDTGQVYTDIRYTSDNAALCASIRIAEKPLAVLTLTLQSRASDEERHRYRNLARIILTNVGEQYALALVNLRLRDRLQQEAIHDPFLTQLYNRRYMKESLRRELLRVQRRDSYLGVMMFDIDHFKQLNDTYTHEAGDIVLQELAALLKRHIREEDIPCRYGGEELVLILPEASLEDTQVRAEELRIIIKQLQVLYQGHILKITVSVGVAAFPQHGFDPDELINTADKALYQAKFNGRDQVVVAPVTSP